MKKFSFIALSALVALASSCNLFEDVKAPGIDKKIDSSSEVQSLELIDLDKEYSAIESHVGTSSSGSYYYVASAPSTLSANVSSTDTKVLVEGELTIESLDLPDIVKPVSGSASNAGLILEFDNTYSQPVDVTAKATVDSKSAKLTGIQAKGSKLTKTAFLLDLDDVDNLEYDTIVIPDVLAGPVSDGVTEHIIVSELELIPEKGVSALSAAGDYNFKIAAKYYSSLTFKKGTKLHVTKTFNDLKLKLDRLDYPLKEYDVYIEFVSTVPFDITASVTSEDGLTGTSDSVIKAGKPGSPVTSEVVLHVVDNSGKNVSEINSATLDLYFVAAEKASFAKGQTLKINAEKLTIQKVK